MRWHRVLGPDRIKLELRTPPGDPEEEMAAGREERKEAILWELVELLERSGKVVNANKLFIDLRNRERKATTGIGEGLAIPHVRTIQAREFVVALGRSTPGIDFGSIDGRRVHIFLAIVSPPYEDKAYLKVYQRVGRMFAGTDLVQRLLAAGDEHEIIRILSDAG